ncbi:L,D-transpeptidase family protein [Candidatus Fermentibacteria bacterium]|nr:L,D-transpeptidase family protein [Candidatus Fermentibacteria bacterium]
MVYCPKGRFRIPVLVVGSLCCMPGILSAAARPDTSLYHGIPWEMLERTTVIPHAVRSGWVERAIRADREKTLAEAYGQVGASWAACPPRLHVYKSQFVAVAEACGHTLKVYPVALSGTPIGAKLRLGDKRTPEGNYLIMRHVSPSYGSCFYVFYPNWVDAFRGFLTGELTYTEFRHIELALQAGVPPPQNTPLGAQILIHTSRTRRDSCATCENWSFGCIVMEHRDLEELLAYAPWGQRLDLTIHPVDVAVDSMALTLSVTGGQSQHLGPKPGSRTEGNETVNIHGVSGPGIQSALSPTRDAGGGDASCEERGDTRGNGR